MRISEKSEIKAKKMAPAAGFEPATKWLTATYSTAELCRSVYAELFCPAYFIIYTRFLRCQADLQEKIDNVPVFLPFS